MKLEVFSDLEPVENWIVDLHVDFRTTDKGTILHLSKEVTFFKILCIFNLTLILYLLLTQFS